MKMGMRTHPGEVYSQNEKAKDRKATLLRLFKLVMEEYDAYDGEHAKAQQRCRGVNEGMTGYYRHTSFLISSRTQVWKRRIREDRFY